MVWLDLHLEYGPHFQLSRLGGVGPVSISWQVGENSFLDVSKQFASWLFLMFNYQQAGGMLGSYHLLK